MAFTIKNGKKEKLKNPEVIENPNNVPDDKIVCKSKDTHQKKVIRLLFIYLAIGIICLIFFGVIIFLYKKQKKESRPSFGVKLV